MPTDDIPAWGSAVLKEEYTPEKCAAAMATLFAAVWGDEPRGKKRRSMKKGPKKGGKKGGGKGC